MTDSDQPHRVYSPTKIYLSPTARAWAREWGMSEQEFAKYLIARHIERGDAFAGDVGEAAGRDDRSGFPPPQNAFEGDVGEAPGGAGIHGFAPTNNYPQGRTALENDVGEAAAAQRLLEEQFPFE